MTVRQILDVLEIRTKVVSVSGFAVGTVYAARHTATDDATGNVAASVILFAAILAVDMGTTGFNSFFDFLRGVDRRGVNREHDKVLVNDRVPALPVFLLSFGLYLTAMIFGVWLSFLVGFEILLVGAISVTVGFLYNTGPIPLSSTPLGEVFAGGFLGWVLVTLSIYVHTGTLDGTDMLVGVPSFLMVASILTVNNTCDIESDRAAGRKTLSIVVGRRVSTVIAVLLGVCAYASSAVLAFRGVFPQNALYLLAAACIVSAFIYRTMILRGLVAGTKGISMQSILYIFVAFSLAVAWPL